MGMLQPVGGVRVSAGANWSAICERANPVVLEARDVTHLAASACDVVASAPFERCGAGTLAEATAAMGVLPEQLGWDIAGLARRFLTLMGTSRLRLRLEGVTGNACRKVHADYTGVRLITTYAGPGTEYVPPGEKPQEDNLVGIPTGWIALLKGRDFAPGHPPCFHRSPPVRDTGVKRLVLVIDTPFEESGFARSGGGMAL